MKALVAPAYISLDQLSVTDAPDPVAGPREVLIEVRAAALNPLDAALVTGAMRELMPVEHPFVVGMDAAGTVAAVGEGVTDFAVGDDVIAYTHFHPGTIAEYTLAAPGPYLAHRPEGLDVVHGAAMPAVSLSAECVVEAASIQPGQTVLIIGATGGVGSFAVQLATQAGATVIATAAPDDIEYALGLGAAEVIDYTGDDPVRHVLQQQPGGVDVVVDLINRGPALATTATAVRVGGRLVSTLMGPDELDRDVTPVYVRMTAPEGRLQRLAEDVAAGRLIVEVATTYALAEAPKALADFAAGKHSRGKVVITV
ncbi:MAG: NADP-dependent oxidoreductase [Pseudonocardiaceae bacterium]